MKGNSEVGLYYNLYLCYPHQSKETCKDWPGYEDREDLKHEWKE